MGHDFNYRVGAGWPVSGTALVPTYANAVRLIEGIAGLRSELIPIAYQHGVNAGSVFKTDARLLALDVDLAGETAAQIFTAHQGIVGLLAGSVGTLVRNDPVNGDVRARILVNQDVNQGSGPERMRWRYPIWLLDGFWEEVAADSEVDTGLTTTGTIGPFTPAGNHPVEPVFTITCQTAGANPKIENAATGDSVELVASYSASDVIVVDIPGRNVTVNGTRDKNALRINRGFYYNLEAGVSATLNWTASSGSWDVTTAWRPRWR